MRNRGRPRYGSVAGKGLPSMIWGAHKADVRIAAKNSVTIRAALRTSINARAIYDAYQDTHPFVTDNITQDRTRARAWAILHVKIDPEPIQAALKKIYTDGFLLGLDASYEALNQAVRQQRQAHSKSAKDELLAQGGNSESVDWDSWTPGHRAAALLYQPSGAFKKLLDNAGIVSKKIAANGYDKIGTALADSIAAGFSPQRTAKVINEKIGDPARALTIAVTEQNRAMSLASMENYDKYGVEKVEWSGANPCDLCAPNEGQVVVTGQAFNSGDTEPPVHPNCRCALLPVIDEAFYAEPNTSGVNDIMPAEETAPREERMTEWQNDELTATERNKYAQFQLNNKKFMETLGNPEKEVGGSFNQNTGNSVYTDLMRYKGVGYISINSYLRTGDPGKYFTKEILDSQITNIDKAMKAAPGSTKDFMTYRGIHTPIQNDITQFFNNLKTGEIFEDKGYGSTSMKSEFANGWKGSTNSWLIQIENPKGTKGIMLDGVKHGTASKEAEWLLPRNSQFEILNKDNKNRTMRVRVVK